MKKSPRSKFKSALKVSFTFGKKIVTLLGKVGSKLLPPLIWLDKKAEPAYKWINKKGANLNKVRKKRVSPLFFDVEKRVEEHLFSSLDTKNGSFASNSSDWLHAVLKEETKDPAGLLLKVIVAFLLLFIVWASIFHINETVKGTGQIISSKHLQVVDNLEGGIIKEILIHEGDVVKAGQTLMRLDPTQNRAKLQELNQDYNRYNLNIQRLRSQIDNREFKPDPEVRKSLPEFTKQEEDLYNTSIENYKKQLASTREEVEGKKHAIAESEEKLKVFQKQLPISEEQLNITTKLQEKGLFSKLKTLDSQKDLLNQKGQISTLEETIPRLKAEMGQAAQKLQKIKSEYDAQNQKELKEAEFKLAEVESNKAIYEDKIQRQEVKAPIDGIVKEIKFETIGGVVQPAQDLITLVPKDDELLAEVKIAPDDIGFLHVGLPAKIKITAFDFTQYGQLNGTISLVSADALQDKEGHSFFRIRIKSDKNFLAKDGKTYYIAPGMPVNADIETGRRTVMSFILKPILRAFDRSFTER